MTSPKDNNPDAAILNEIRELTGRIRDGRTQVILRSVIDAVALNPQPLPPRVHKLLQAVVVDPTWHIVERVSEEMDVAALIGRLRQNLAQRRSEPGVIVGHDKLDTVQTPRLEPQ